MVTFASWRENVIIEATSLTRPNSGFFIPKDTLLDNSSILNVKDLKLELLGLHLSFTCKISTFLNLFSDKKLNQNTTGKNTKPRKVNFLDVQKLHKERNIAQTVTSSLHLFVRQNDVCNRSSVIEKDLTFLVK